MTNVGRARIAVGVLAVAALTWLLLPANTGGLWLVTGMFLIGMLGGAVLYWRWSPLIEPIAIVAGGELRYQMDCQNCPAGDGPPWIVGMFALVGIMLIPAAGAAIGGGIVGLIDEFSG